MYRALITLIALCNTAFAFGEKTALPLNPIGVSLTAFADAEQSPVAFEHITLEKRARVCEAAGLAPGCLKVCRVSDGAEGPIQRCRPRARAYAERGQVIGYICDRHRCMPARRVSGSEVIRLDDRICEVPATAVVQQVRPTLSRSVIAVIPPIIWDWFNDTPCCEACWAQHRSWGLACSADYACCFGTCGIQPGCTDGGGGSGGGSGGAGGGGGGGDGGDGESCGSSRQVHGATVQYNGQTCFFDGTVNPTMVNGECLDIAGEGVIYGCTGEVVIEVGEEAETETPTP